MEKLLENISEYMDDPLKNGAIANSLRELSPAELEELWDSLTSEQTLQLFLIIDQETRSALMAELNHSDQEFLLEGLSEQLTKDLLLYMEPDDLADLIQSVSSDVRENLWSNLTEDSRREIEFLLRYDEDDAAGIMTPRYGALRAEITVEQAISFVRRDMADKLETIYYLYVVDGFKRLIGVISLRQLLSAENNETVGDLMERNVIYVKDETDQEDAARVLEDNDFLAIPVVDDQLRLLGIVTFDDVIDVIREEQTEDIYKMGAMGGNTDSYLETSVFGLVLKRLPWLIILLLAGTITTNVLDGYSELTVTALFLTLFVPVITQTGGNTGTQSSTLMIRGLATGELKFRDLGKVLFKELFVAFIIGLATGGVIFLRSLYLPPGLELLEALTIASALSCVVLFATLLGCLVPMVIHRLGFDPTVAAGPLMSTVIDVCGLTIYYEIARLVLKL
ncbi:MAG: magnesium transporter [Spirochaetales bacterium]|nr:magnesium transporter [Spirochaetales bacterium]